RGAGHDAEFRRAAGEMRRISTGDHGFGRNAACIDAGPTKKPALNDRDLLPGISQALGQGRPSLSGANNNGFVRDAHGLISRTWGRSPLSSFESRPVASRDRL